MDLNQISAERLSIEIGTFDLDHCDLKVSRSQAEIDESFANYFLKTKANNK